MEKINKFRLDEELENQHMSHQLIGEKLAEAEYERDVAKKDFEKMEAKISIDFRKSCKEKMTEKQLNELVLQTDEYNKAYLHYLEKKRIAKEISTDEESSKQRKSSLEGLVKLFLNSYWGECKVPNAEKDKLGNSTRDTINEELSQNSRIRRRQ